MLYLFGLETSYVYEIELSWCLVDVSTCTYKKERSTEEFNAKRKGKKLKWLGSITITPNLLK